MYFFHIILAICLNTYVNERFSLFLSFGKNMPALYKIFYDFVPAFNKFRAPSMALCLLQFAVPVLAGYGIASVFSWSKDVSKETKRKGLIVGAASLGVFVIMFFMGTSEDASVEGRDTEYNQ